MKPLLGMTQGRLVPSVTGQLQCFPQSMWDQEFDLAASVGLDYIEWLVERQYNPDNPIWIEAGRHQIRAAADRCGLRLYSMVNDYPLDHDLAEGAEALDQTLDLLAHAAPLGFQMVVVPLYDASEVASRAIDPFLGPLRRIAQRAAADGIEIVLETSLPGRTMQTLMAAVGQDNVAVCFDTGNRAALSQDIYGDLRLLNPFLRHVHVKDKNREGQNVLLGTGLVDFYRVCESLAAARYAAAFTFETPRGHDPLRTARFHKAFLEFFLHEAEIRVGLAPSARE